MPATIPKLTVYYGRKPGDMTNFLAAAGSDIVAVEPAFFTTAPTANSYAYFSATGVNRSNKMLKPLHAKLEAIGGLLGKDDPYGPGSSMVDTRKPDARKAMRDFLFSGWLDTYKGVMLDAIVSAEIMESDYPQYAGLLDSTLLLISEIATALHPSKKLIANSLLQSDAAMRAMGKAADYVMCESQCALEGELRTASDNAWTIAKLSAVAKGAKGRKVGILFVEPGAGDAKTAVAKAAPAMVQKIITAANNTTADKPLSAAGLTVITAPDFQHLEG